ncbi:MAG TPA: DNA gyrase inhibitor YacG [Geobacteraceae bacterium]
MNKLTKIRCPHCRKETTLQGNPFRPFCSDRCQLIDMGAWVNEEYRIPGADAAHGTDGADGEPF